MSGYLNGNIVMKSKIDKTTSGKLSVFNVNKKIIRANQSQVELQNKLLESIKKGSFKAIKKIESNLINPSYAFMNEEGICPLIASVYSLRLNVVNYVEEKLQGQLMEEWKKCNIETLIHMFKKQQEDLISEIIYYSDYSQWYFKNKNAIWNTLYDEKLLSIMQCTNWSKEQFDWEPRSNMDWTVRQFELITNKRRCNVQESENGNILIYPSLTAHQNTVRLINDLLNDMINHLCKINELFKSKTNQCGPECNFFLSTTHCLFKLGCDDIEDLVPEKSIKF